jgi:acetoacetate decarboxylase
MFLDNVPAILAGREILGFPKVFASPRLGIRGNSRVGELDMEGTRVATATMGYKHRTVDHETVRQSLSAPGFLLKKIPGVDGTPRVCELVRYQVSDLTIHGAWTGPASLEFHRHALANLAQLPVREVLSAIHIITDLSLGDGTVVHDYLAGTSHGSHIDKGHP